MAAKKPFGKPGTNDMLAAGLAKAKPVGEKSPPAPAPKGKPKKKPSHPFEKSGFDDDTGMVEGSPADIKADAKQKVAYNKAKSKPKK